MIVIKDNKELKKYCEKLSNDEFITVDTEFMRTTTFWPDLCLIQLAGPSGECIIDPIENDIDLADFFELMRKPEVTKVIHSGRQDLEIFYKLSGELPKPLFDTQVAAMVCGYGEQVGYSQLVMEIIGEKIDKASQFTDWSIRPLSEAQLQYALADVTYLRDVYRNLKDNLEKNNRSEWLEEEMEILNDPLTYDPPLDSLWKKIKNKFNKSEDLAVLQCLAIWRETQARKRNLVRNRIMKDETLVEIAQQKPKNIGDMKKLRTLPRRYTKDSDAKGIIKIVRQGLEMPKDKMPKVKIGMAMPKEKRAGLELIKMLLKIVAEKEGVAAKLIATSNQLEKLIAKPQEENIIMKGWRYKIFGEQAQKMLNGEIVIGFENDKIILK